ncbi:MAG: VOC family protein, partial [Clostridiaceae bacterium]|nr:VOC family protein [Clostridiaceae bacterium]
ADPEALDRITQALLPMKRIDIATLERAYRGE